MRDRRPGILTPVTDPPPLLGRKPRWQQRWEERSQREIEERAHWAAQPVREWNEHFWDVTTPDGRDYSVRAVRRGRIIWIPGLSAGGRLVFMLSDAVGWLISLRLTGWRVGVLRDRWLGERLVFSARCATEAEVKQLIAELARRLRAGEPLG